MFCVTTNNSVTTTGGVIADVGTAASAQAYVDGASVASSSVQSQIFACNGVNGIGSGGSGTTAGIPLTPDEIIGLRKEFGLSQRDFSEFLGLGGATIGRWEARKNFPAKGYDHLLKILNLSNLMR